MHRRRRRRPPDPGPDGRRADHHGTDLAAKKSHLLVWDAQTFPSDPVAKVRMPQRVPDGLHGNWLPAKGDGDCRPLDVALTVFERLGFSMNWLSFSRSRPG